LERKEEIDLVTLQRAMRNQSDRVLPQICRVNNHKIEILEVWSVVEMKHEMSLCWNSNPDDGDKLG